MTNAKKDSPKVVEATRKSQRQKYFFGFRLKNNKAKVVQGVRKAKQYEDESKELITEKLSFTTKSAADKWASAQVTKTPESKKDLSTIFVDTMNGDERAKVDRALKEIDSKRPTDRIEIFPKTNSRSKAVAFIVRFLDVQGRDNWMIKPEQFSLAISKWSNIFKQEDDVVGQALCNFAFSRMRDLSGDPDKVSTKSWTSPTTNTERFFDVHLCHSHFLLPDLETLPTKEDETSFIKTKCKEIGETLLYVVKQESFKMCYERAINHPKIWDAVSGKNAKTPSGGYVDFIKNCRAWVTPCENFNSHVVKDDMINLLQILQDHEYDDVKYESEDPICADDKDYESDDDSVIQNDGPDNDTEELTLEQKIDQAFAANPAE